MNSEIARSKIPEAVKDQLWAIAAGRCEICNRILYSNLTFGKVGNYAQMAHIHAVSKNGPRHKKDMSKDELNNVNNLMLLCPDDHHLIDSNPEKYGNGLLLEYKKNHEDRIRRVTEIRRDQTCRIVTYFSNIGDQEVFYDERLFKEALIENGLLPKQYDPIRLYGNTDASYQPSKENIDEKKKELFEKYRSWYETIVKSEESIAIFALAPQSLLFYLGTLLNDQHNVKVFQCHRVGHKWAWENNEDSVDFKYYVSKKGNFKNVALVLDLSAKVLDDRITEVLGENCAIYHLTIKNPNRDFVSNEFIQDEFVKAFRNCLEDIKNQRPKAKEIHVFPVMPNSLNIRAGMDYMPKADLPLKIYEQDNSRNGFFFAEEIGG